MSQGLVVGDLRVQAVERGNETRAFTIVWPDGGVHFLYENTEARALVAESIRHSASGEHASALPIPRGEDGWRDRALNAEAALKDTHGEIRTQRNRIGQLMGYVRDLETHQPQESAQRITIENTALKERMRQLAQDKRALEDRLQAARSNARFLTSSCTVSGETSSS